MLFCKGRLIVKDLICIQERILSLNTMCQRSETAFKKICFILWQRSRKSCCCFSVNHHFIGAKCIESASCRPIWCKLHQLSLSKRWVGVQTGSWFYTTDILFEVPWLSRAWTAIAGFLQAEDREETVDKSVMEGDAERSWQGSAGAVKLR